MGGWDPMGGVSVRGEARPRVRIEVLVVQRFVWCKRWMRIGAWGGVGSFGSDQARRCGCGEDSCARARQASDRQARRADKGAAASRTRNRRGCNAGGREWLRLEHYYGLYMHNITPSHLQLTAMIDSGKG
jgi:hypothetical protein